ncbi:GNAT family N-acetyltransferase [Deinococcus sp. KNUC1210]|uniref:GNAT family N-acetyltransferase n=1 Tax=Deinococcus sp. KNUC1210 TaxID=2917691 RepID=UPI001EF0DD87|nr:GNAT family N-acetyltransferase [Deinococcus sp. KNUC1210]ULH14796.1 GNAT family N-acetyltransferase [Deinococcus sp. KNUC1210]
MVFSVSEWPDCTRLAALHGAAFGYAADAEDAERWERVLKRSLCWVTAHVDGALVGFVNVAWDGGQHAFLLDTAVHPDFGRRGIGTRLVREAAQAAAARGAGWLHVDYEPPLEGFYRSCGFGDTRAGLLKLR